MQWDELLWFEKSEFNSYWNVLTDSGQIFISPIVLRIGSGSYTETLFHISISIGLICALLSKLIIHITHMHMRRRRIYFNCWWIFYSYLSISMYRTFWIGKYVRECVYHTWPSVTFVQFCCYIRTAYYLILFMVICSWMQSKGKKRRLIVSFSEEFRRFGESHFSISLVRHL